MSRLHGTLATGLAGMLFGLGLAVAGMTDPDKVQNFLDLGGAWDPSLALVMAAALAVATPGFAWIRRRARALNGDPIALPTATRIDRPLVIGALLFGIGWGLVGLCPGPAIANLARANADLLLFLGAMALGSALAAIGRPR